MVILHRAVQAEDKAARRAAILDAAETLLAKDSENLASVAQVAEATGLAKGTMYLYFKTKEEIIMAVHERHSMALFDRIDAMFAEAGAGLTVERAIDSFCQFVHATPLYLQLGCFCHLTLERNIDLEVVYRFRLNISGRLQKAGAMLWRPAFPALPPMGIWSATAARHLRLRAGLLAACRTFVPRARDEPASRDGIFSPRFLPGSAAWIARALARAPQRVRHRGTRCHLRPTRPLSIQRGKTK